MYLGARDTSAVSGDAQLAALIANLGSRSTKFSIGHSIIVRASHVAYPDMPPANIPSFPSSQKKKKEINRVETRGTLSISFYTFSR